MLHFDDVSGEIQNICEDLMKLACAPGPTGAVARIAENDPRISSEYPITQVIREIVEKRFVSENNISFYEDHGNLVLISCNDDSLTNSKIRSIPVVLTSHLDEITYLVCESHKDDEKKYRLLPLCNAPKKILPTTNTPFMYKEARVMGARATRISLLIEDLIKFGPNMDRRSQQFFYFFCGNIKLRNYILMELNKAYGITSILNEVKEKINTTLIRE